MEEISAVEKEFEFLRFLLVTNTTQGILLLKHATPAQTNAVSEIFHNLLHSQDLGDELVHSLKKHKLLIRRVGEIGVGLQRRRFVLIKQARVILKILHLVESILPSADVRYVQTTPTGSRRQIPSVAELGEDAESGRSITAEKRAEEGGDDE